MWGLIDRLLHILTTCKLSDSGRAQELLLILDEYWAAHPELHDVPIYYASSLAKVL
jgi:Cft2 family RNA processing exonuclease